MNCLLSAVVLAGLVGSLAGSLAAPATAADLDYRYGLGPAVVAPAYPPAPVEGVEGFATNGVLEAAPPLVAVPPISLLGGPIVIGAAAAAPPLPPSPVSPEFYPRPVVAPRPAYGAYGAYAAAPPPPPPPALPYGYGY